MPSPIDTYITKAAPFARPILEHLRAIVHQGCPDVEETLKWGMPSFEHHGILCGMAAFKAHCSFGFWRGREVAEAVGEPARRGDAMGDFGRITSVKDLPPRKVLVRWVRAAAQLNEAGPARRAALPRKPSPRIPPDLAKALTLKAHAAAAATWKGYPPSHRREYIEWITEAKRPETRAKRLATTLAWLAEGKDRNWKYR